MTDNDIKELLIACYKVKLHVNVVKSQMVRQATMSGSRKKYPAISTKYFVDVYRKRKVLDEETCKRKVKLVSVADRKLCYGINQVCIYLAELYRNETSTKRG